MSKTAERMRNPFPKGSPEAFFWKHAGYSYGQDESPADGRARCAKSLTEAERRGSDAGLSFEWEQDTETDASFRNTRTPYHLWVCICRSEAGEVLSSLFGIDFGRNGSPYSDPYRRVVEAELASEVCA